MPPKRNAIARDLGTAKYRKRVVRALKGKGSYKRPQSRRPDTSRDGGSVFRGRVARAVQGAAVRASWRRGARGPAPR